MSTQSPDAVVMIRPHHFQSNEETRADNGFQTRNIGEEAHIAGRALIEFDRAADLLRGAGVRVHIFDDTAKDRPDSVFPNNWFSTHAGGHIAIYPMYAHSRRKERRWDVIEFLKSAYRVQDVIDYSGLETDDLALEGTGAMVLDHVARVAYVAKSNRADPIILERFCTHFNYEPMAFDAVDGKGRAIYHTNVMMALGQKFALICLDAIKDQDRRNHIVDRLEETGKEVFALSLAQIDQFAGNAFELDGTGGPVLALSQTARDALSDHVVSRLSHYCKILTIPIPTIETAGGSVRCMLAGIHLAQR